jgi:hypothetical protein
MKNNLLKLSILSFISIVLISCNDAKMQKTINTINDVMAEPGSANKPLTNVEVVKGLRQALEIGVKNSVKYLSEPDGFYKDPLFFIPFPEEAIRVKNTLTNLGFEGSIADFEMTMNRAAEVATKEATPIFVNAITEMTLQDGFAILKGNDDAATQYLKNTTSEELKLKFQPIIKNAIETVQLTSYWNPLVTKYNSIPLVNKVNPDLEDYITTKALDGLFISIAKEEDMMRKIPQARATELLKRVFGSLDK